MLDCKGFDTFTAKQPLKKIQSYNESQYYVELRKSTSADNRETSMNLLKIKNQLNQTREANRRVLKLLEVNKTIKELGNVSLKKYN